MKFLKVNYFFHFWQYSYLPNKQGDSNKRGGWQNSPNGEGGKIFCIHARVENFCKSNKRTCRGWKFLLK